MMPRIARAASFAWTRSFGGAVHWLLKVQGTAHRRATHEELVRECCPTVSTRRVLGDFRCQLCQLEHRCLLEYSKLCLDYAWIMPRIMP